MKMLIRLKNIHYPGGGKGQNGLGHGKGDFNWICNNSTFDKSG